MAAIVGAGDAAERVVWKLPTPLRWLLLQTVAVVTFAISCAALPFILVGGLASAVNQWARRPLIIMKAARRLAREPAAAAPIASPSADDGVIELAAERARRGDPS